MIWRVVARPEVDADMAEAATWYEDQQPGLGAEFLEEVFRVWDALAENPLLNSRRTRRRNLHWRYSDDFPTGSFMRSTKPNAPSSSMRSLTPRGTTGTGNGGFKKRRSRSPLELLTFPLHPSIQTQIRISPAKKSPPLSFDF